MARNRLLIDRRSATIPTIDDRGRSGPDDDREQQHNRCLLRFEWRFNLAPITTTTAAGDIQSLKLTAATNDGGVYIQDSSPAGLTINSVTADQGGQAPTVSQWPNRLQQHPQRYRYSNLRFWKQRRHDHLHGTDRTELR